MRRRRIRRARPRPRHRLAWLVFRWLVQGTRLALLLGVVALGAAVMLLAAVTFWPLVVVLGGVALLGWAGGRPERRAARAPRRRAAGPQPNWAALPAEARRRCEATRSRADALAAAALGAEDRYLVRATVEAYLPDAVDAYVSLPPGAAGRPVAPDGRNGLRMLLDQLDLIDRSLDGIAERAWQAGAQRLLANQRFLEERLPPR